MYLRFQLPRVCASVNKTGQLKFTNIPSLVEFPILHSPEVIRFANCSKKSRLLLVIRSELPNDADHLVNGDEQEESGLPVIRSELPNDADNLVNGDEQEQKSAKKNFWKLLGETIMEVYAESLRKQVIKVMNVMDLAFLFVLKKYFPDIVNACAEFGPLILIGWFMVRVVLYALLKQHKKKK